MKRVILGTLVVLASLIGGVPALAQDARLDGYVTDEQGSAIPGVTVTATGPSLIVPAVAVSDSRGYCLLASLQPGDYALTAELTGFRTARREGLQARAGSTFTVDFALSIGGLQETVLVSGTPPLIDARSPTTTVNVSGDLLRRAPLSSRRLWSDVLDLAPAVSSRQISGLDMGKRAYYYLGAHIFAHSLSINGAPAAAYSDGGAHSVDLGGDAVVEVEIKTGGLDAASPNSTGVVTNVITRRGGDSFEGGASFTHQSLDWNGNNAGDGLPSTQGVNITDLTLGGPIARGRVWFFGLLRYSDLDNGISRTAADLAFLRAFRPDFTPFNNWSRSYQPYVSTTVQATPNQSLQAFVQHDRSRFVQDGARNTDRIAEGGTGGSLVNVRLSSVWGRRVTTQFSASWNNKSGAGADTYKAHTGVGPSVVVHRDAFLSRGIPTGSGALVTMNNTQSLDIRKGEVAVLRGDLTFLQQSGVGSHEFRTGFYAAPRLRYDVFTQAVNGGFVLEEVRQADSNNPAAGLVPFHRRYVDVPNEHVVKARDRDVGVYVQDSWKPGPSLTVNAGVRVEFVRRFDDLFGVERQRSVDFGPRLGVAYATQDGLTVFRASYGRVHEAVNGRDPITLLGSPIGSGGGVVTQTSRSRSRDEYDTNGDGVMDSIVITPASAARLYDLEFADGLHQPYIDEAIVGVRRQFAARIGLDVSWTRRYYRDRWAVVDINGIYPDQPGQPFGGFGRVDPTRGLFYQQRNADWSTQVISALQVVASKSLSNGLEFLVGLNRQWQHLSGTWNPTDPARFIQPDAFPNNRELGHIFGNDEHNSLDGRGVPSGAANRPYSVRVAGRYAAAGDIRLAASYVIQAGDYSGPILTRLAAADPVFGPATITLANGTTQPNPLATTIRFAGATRSDGQVRNDTSRYLQLSASRVFRFAGGQQIEPTVNLFNVFNNGAQTQFAAGGNQLYSPNYLAGANQHPPRSVSLTLGYRF